MRAHVLLNQKNSGSLEISWVQRRLRKNASKKVPLPFNKFRLPAKIMVIISHMFIYFGSTHPRFQSPGSATKP